MQRIIAAYAPSNPYAHTYVVDMSYPWVVGYRRWPFVRSWWKYADIDLAVKERESGH